MAFIIYHFSSVEAFAPLKHYCFWVPTCCAQRVLWTVMYIVCDMGNKLWCERDLIVVAHFKRHLLFAISTRPRAACDISYDFLKLSVKGTHATCSSKSCEWLNRCKDVHSRFSWTQRIGNNENISTRWKQITLATKCYSSEYWA